MIMQDTVLEGCANFDYLGLFDVHINLSKQGQAFFAFIKNATAVTEFLSRDLRVGS